MRIALMITCLVDAMAPQVGQATVRLLRRLGCAVEVPLAQTCCGQMHINTGYPRESLPLLRNHIAAFENYDAIVVPSASCVGCVRHQHVPLAQASEDSALADALDAIARRTYELTEFLVDVLDTTHVGAYFPHRVTYHPTCHSLRVLRVGDRPVRLLRSVEGIDLVELPQAESCCGFGGTFAIKNSDTSSAMLATKMRDVMSTQAEVCAASDASCLLHIDGGLSRLKTGVRSMHIAEILAATRTEAASARAR